MKKLVLVLVWLAGSAAAVGVAWAGVSVVDDQIVDPPPAFDLQAAVADPNGAEADPAEATITDAAITDAATTDAATTDATTTDVTTDQPGNDSGSATTQVQSSTTAATVASSTTANSTTSTTAATAASSATDTSTTSSTAPQTDEPVPAAATTLTFSLVGGTTAIAFSPDRVEVLWATPNPGFEVRIEPESPGIKVEFRADHHESQIEAWWSDGPRHEIEEEVED